LYLWIGPAEAVLTIKITQGASGALPIAVVPFGDPDGQAIAVDLAGVIAADLAGSGRFATMPRRDMPGQPRGPSEIKYSDWQRLGMDNLVVGTVRRGSQAEYQVEFWLLDVYKGTQLLAFTVPAAGPQLRLVAHQIADVIFEKLTGIRGAFATRIAYVTLYKVGSQRRYELQVADIDGQNPQTLLSSPQPLLSPAWSPDGGQIAYVSFEGNNSAVYVQHIASGHRERISAQPGLNSAPAWSPDGRKLALTLSRDGNPEIYTVDLASRRFERITDDPAIDTEAAWSPDGKRLAFTSDRGGGPQVYEVAVYGGPPRRLTHRGSYNARPRYSSDGKMLAVVHGDKSGYRIATLDLGSEHLQVLTNARLDESPSFAPNDSMIVYATVGAHGTELAITSVDGSVRQRLALQRGEIREPAWGPMRK
jgi:TolB protein